MSAVLGRAAKLAERNPSWRETRHFAGRGARRSDKREPAHHALRAKEGRELLVGAQAVLQGKNRRVRAEQRRQQAREFAVGRRLECDDDKIDRPISPATPNAATGRSSVVPLF